ncbi:UDP-N-acetylmuramoyl-L-alanyl-D-glutamate--2,6-diaminopimelate ligase [Nocardioides alcanivorans]|uniref:UDP-N-acetylmuramoyl-L-alanyl-D-glutamate--2, 6-diaminopimelate ligase n=1 Tax=Nocardioides alcanivorans TaxID=2897352 RepID=UPI001F40FB6D
MTEAEVRRTRPAESRRTPLRELAALLGLPESDDATEVTGVTLSTDRVLPGDLYAALPGARVHGASFAGAAVASGAVAVLTDAAGAEIVADAGVPTLVVESPRTVLGAVSAHVYGHPTRSLRMIGVTGTQGKTTVTRLVDLALTGADVPSAVIGTIGTRILGDEVPTRLTTPEAPDLQALFARMVEAGVETCAMEVSSHALAMGRVDGIVFDVAVFTNLGRDHLDFHADLEEYFQVKASLFTARRCKRAVVSRDDEHGRRLVAHAQVPTETFSVHDSGADWSAHAVVATARGSAFDVVHGDDAVATGVPIAGEFNVANGLAALAAGSLSGHDLPRLAAALVSGAGVPGRLERVETGLGFETVVDYAHKPDAVEAALSTLRPLTDGRLICVIGAGGDRDTGKRPVMGEIAARLSDLVIVTDDNPRSEDPAAIRAAVLAGCAGPAEVLEIGDRRSAIRAALGRARPGDVVLVAGKGHETGQEVAGVVHPFDDCTVVAEEAGALVEEAGALVEEAGALVEEARR